MTATPDSTFADKGPSNTDLQRELAELRRTLDDALHERDEALQRETATGEVLQVINSSPGDLGPVFDAMLEKAMALCETSFGGFFIHEAGRLRAAAARGVPLRLEDFVRQGFALNLSIWMSRGAPPQHVVDLAKEDLAEQAGNRAARD